MDKCEYWLDIVKHCGNLIGRTGPPKCGGNLLECPTVYDAVEG